MNAKLPCPDSNTLERLLVGDMLAEEMAALEHHVGACQRCLAVLRDVRSSDALLQAVHAAGQGGCGEAVDEALIGRLCQLAGAETLPSALRRDTLSTGPLKWHGDEELVGLLEPPVEQDELGRFGSYGILRVLGSGGMGVVFAARQARPRRVVALKMILAGRHGLARFRSETEVIAQLRHPNIVQVLEVGEHAGRAYYTMEYMEGGNLAQKLAAAPLAPRAAAELTVAMARAVQSAHDGAVVHRDLKPANVLLAADGTPKIADFGLAKHLEGESSETSPMAHTQTGAILGTPGYMAPEQAAGAKEVGPAADVYALGAVLYECLTGRPPFKAATVLETLEQVRSREPVAPGSLQPGLPRDLQTICLKCLHKEPRRRYSSAAALADDLGRYLRGEPIHARPVPLRERLAKWVRRRPAAAALLAVSVVSAAAIVTGIVLHNRSLHAALTRAEAGEAAARRQQQRADAGYRAANDALDRMLQRLERRQLGEVPQLKDLQREQREDALAFYGGILAGADDPDPEIRLDAAHAYERTASIQQVLGDAACVENFSRAIALVEALPPAQRDLPKTQALLAGCYGDRGMAIAGNRGADAARDIAKALAVYEKLAQAKPDDPQMQENLARCAHQLGNVALNDKRLADSERHFSHAVAFRTALVREHPEEELYQFGLAEDYVNLGLVFAQTHRPAQAIAAYEKADALLRPLTARRPDDIRHALALAAVDIDWSNMLEETGHLQDTLTQATEAVDLAESALRREPAFVMARQFALNAHGTRAQHYDRFGLWVQAAKDWQRVVELDDGPSRWTRQTFLALDLARTGDHSRASAAAKGLRNNPDVTANGDGMYLVAAIYARCAEAAQSDDRLPPRDQAALAERYAAEAVAILGELKAKGYFNQAPNAESLTTDPDLKPLQERPDFQKLLPHR